MKFTVGIIALSLMAAGCGGSTKSASAEESAAASKIVGPMMKENAGKNSAGMNMRALRVVRNYLQANVHTTDDATAVCDNLDASFGDDGTGMTCKKNSCSINQAAGSIDIDVACSSTQSFKYTCDSVDYTVKNLSAGFKINISGQTGSFSVSFGANILGGALTGTGDLSCSLSSNLTDQTTEPSADDVTCKYDDKKIDPATFKDSYDSSTSSCTSSEITQN